uniref:type I restriction-modification system subunit M N-terminal domain-containing protein n=1 Tax=uncultured Corynebacterium sp. TaxID=159447 RepID=UPI00259B700D
MADIAKEVAENAPAGGFAQRTELHKTIWKIANGLRGSVDGWDFKSYVLNMLFYRFISENEGVRFFVCGGWFTSSPRI